MGENNYQNQYNQYTTQNYSFVQYQLQRMPFPNTIHPQNAMLTASSSTPVYNTGGGPSANQSIPLASQSVPPFYGSLPLNNTPMTFYPQSQLTTFTSTVLSQSGQFTVGTSTSVPSTGAAPSNQATISGIQPAISTMYGYQLNNNKPLPLYQQSQTSSPSQQMPFSDTRLPQGDQFTGSTSIPAPSNQASNSSIQPAISASVHSSLQHNNKPLPLYQQSKPLSQPQQMTFSSSRIPEPSQFTDSTSTSIPYSGATSTSGIQPSSSALSQQFDDDGKPPPSYEESQYDRLIRRSKSGCTYSASGNNGSDTKKKEVNHPNDSFSNLFDIPGQSKVVKSETFNPTQISQQEPQERFSHNISYNQHSSTTFPTEHGGSFNSRFLHGDKKGIGKNNPNYRGGFRGRRNEQNRGRFGDCRNMQEYNSYQSKNRGWPGDGENLQEYNSYQSENRARPGDSRNLQEYNSYQSEEKSFPEDYNDGYKEGEQGEDEGEGDGERNEEYDEEDGNGDFDKTNVFIPDEWLLKKYEFFPPSPEEMGEFFKDMVIYFFYKTARNKKEHNPFVVICESFRRSERYNGLQVEDGYDPNVKDRKFCTLRYNGMMLVRGVGENNCIKEARVRAGVELINILAMTCYTLDAKGDFFNVPALERMKQRGSVPGVYTIVPKEEIQDIESARKYLERVVSEGDSDVEYIFPFPQTKLAKPFKHWVKNFRPSMCVRVIKDGCLGICRSRTPQYWRDKLLAKGTMETEKFKLEPPQGIGRLLLQNFDYRGAVVQLKNKKIRECELSNRYGPPGVGPRISRAKPPWAKRANDKLRRNLKKENAIIDKMRRGEPVNYKFLSKHSKKRLKKKLMGLTGH